MTNRDDEYRARQLLTEAADKRNAMTTDTKPLSQEELDHMPPNPFGVLLSKLAETQLERDRWKARADGLEAAHANMVCKNNGGRYCHWPKVDECPEVLAGERNCVLKAALQPTPAVTSPALDKEIG